MALLSCQRQAAKKAGNEFGRSPDEHGEPPDKVIKSRGEFIAGPLEGSAQKPAAPAETMEQKVNRMIQENREKLNLQRRARDKRPSGDAK